MKTILLFRHGKSEISTDFCKDHDRSLVSEGIKEAGRMGIYLARINALPDLVISSTALRAITTSDIAMKKGKWTCPMIQEGGIYGGSPSFLLNLVQNQDDKFSSICLVGHEPNFSSFIVQSTDSNYRCFPTASMAKIDFDVNRWEHITMGFGNFDWQVQPNKL